MLCCKPGLGQALECSCLYGLQEVQLPCVAFDLFFPKLQGFTGKYSAMLAFLT